VRGEGENVNNSTEVFKLKKLDNKSGMIPSYLYDYNEPKFQNIYE